MKGDLERERQMNEELRQTKANLKEKVEIWERKYEACREMYELEQNNHQQLRHFYEKR